MSWGKKAANHVRDSWSFGTAPMDHPDAVAEVDRKTWGRNRQAERDAKAPKKGQKR